MSKKAKVLLIAPNLKGIKNGINRIQPGLGIGYLAAVLREGGHEVFVRDTALEGYNNISDLEEKDLILIGESDDEITNYISNLAPDIVGISALFSNLMEHSHTIARITKNINPKTTVVLGGNHISNAAVDYLFALNNPDCGIPKTMVDLEDSNIDYAMRGEVENSFLQFVNKLMNDEDPKDVPGLVYLKDGELCINPCADVMDMSELPFPARDLMNMEEYFNIGKFHSGKSKSNRVLNVMAARGCPEKCTFCTTPEMWGASVRWRDPQNIYQEIKGAIEKYDIGEVQFEDDTLTINRKLLLELCDLLEPLGIRWCTPNGTKVNYHQSGTQQYDMYKRMADAGCYQVTLACESGVQRVLDDIVVKNLQLEQMKPAVESAKAAGLLVHTFWIVGYPGETREEMEETINFAANLEADSYSISILCPLPGTPIYHKVMKENLWWEKSQGGFKDLLVTLSTIKVDGFNNRKEFENWIDEKTLYLNNLLKERDIDRFKMHYGDNSGAKFLRQQT